MTARPLARMLMHGCG